MKKRLQTHVEHTRERARGIVGVERGVQPMWPVEGGLDRHLARLFVAHFTHITMSGSGVKIERMPSSKLKTGLDIDLALIDAIENEFGRSSMVDVLLVLVKSVDAPERAYSVRLLPLPVGP